MSAIDRSVAALRIMGDELRPEEITRLLGCSPSHSQRKGEVFRNEKSGKERVARFGMWQLKATDRQPGDPDTQIAEILEKISATHDTWRSITASFRADIFFGLFMEEWNEGFSLSPKTLLELGSRGIEVGFDIYGPEERDQPSNED